MERSELVEQLKETTFEIGSGGFVQFIDVMGDDQRVVDAARGSYGKGTKRISEDEALIRYLMRKYHTTPFEMPELTFRVQVPMDTWRQWIRHRTASVNEYSTRYSEAIDDWFRTPADSWRLQDAGNKQGSDGYFDDSDGAEFSKAEEKIHSLTNNCYQYMLKHNVAREQARKILPLDTYTLSFWKIDLHNLFHFLNLRMDSHAQLEIREYANCIGEQIVAKLFPSCWQAFLDYRLNAITLSALEIELIQNLIGAGNNGRVSERYISLKWFDLFAGRSTKRECNEATEKLKLLGMIQDGPATDVPF